MSRLRGGSRGGSRGGCCGLSSGECGGDVAWMTGEPHAGETSPAAEMHGVDSEAAGDATPISD